jgi:LacI family gluconate utilization system Gnt-I transcriptional repressor
MPAPTTTVPATAPPAPTASGVRIHDVARAAGVSLVTVSRAVNHPEQLAPETLARVRTAIAALGYVPNLNAGSLATRRSGIVGAIVPTVANAVFSETVEALTQVLGASGYQLLLGQSGYRDEDEAALVETFLGRRVEGLVLTGTGQSPALLQRICAAGVALVQTWDLDDAPADMQVGFDNRAAGAVVATHLLGRGHRRLGVIGAEEPRSRQRLEGFRQAAHATDATTRVEAALMAAPAQPDGVGAALQTLLDRLPDLQAVFCTNDLIAAALLFECHRRGWAVPQRLAVVGMGDLALARATWPRLTTLRIHGQRIGECAGQMLRARLQGQPTAEPQVNVGVTLVERDSG